MERDERETGRAPSVTGPALRTLATCVRACVRACVPTLRVVVLPSILRQGSLAGGRASGCLFMIRHWILIRRAVQDSEVAEEDIETSDHAAVWMLVTKPPGAIKQAPKLLSGTSDLVSREGSRADSRTVVTSLCTEVSTGCRRL